LKNDLLDIPLKREFEYGQSNEVIWCYKHMVLKIEGCVNVLNVLILNFKFMFIFDHSCGHDRQQEDGLNVENMSKSNGEKQHAL